MTKTNNEFFWSLPQPVYVFFCTFLVASASVTGWMDSGTLAGLILLLTIPLCWIAERLIPKRKDWLLDSSDFYEDVFWVTAGYLIWIPLYDRYYDSALASVFSDLRESLGVSFTFTADTMLGMVAMAVVAAIVIEFIGYWAHRFQHRYLFLWRIHATHHHIVKMSVARADRTHPLEFLGLNLGSAVVMAFFGATPEIAAVTLTLRITNARLNHCNLPFRSGIFGWLFTTAEWHSNHHSNVHEESNTNYGCVIILWDRVFGTFNGSSDVARVGNGSGEKLSLWIQFALPFYSNERIRKL